MNWVGGSRSRYMMRCDTKKQREFFEKKKLNRRLHNMGIPVPTSPKGATSGSMDLVTLFIVNQIAAKKEVKDKPVVTVLRDGKGPSRTMNNRPLELPMSPASPSQLSLSESEPYYSVQRVKRRKHCISDAFRCQQLSPVLESSFSDHSSSEPVQHPIPHPLSPFSSACSASSRQVFPGQPDLQHRDLSQLHPCSQSAPAWTTSDLHQIQFRPFSQPGTMRDATQWCSGSTTPGYLPDPPAVSRALFRSPRSQDGQARDQGGFSRFPVSRSEDRLPLLGFTLNQSETEEPFEEELFSGFGGEGSHYFGKVKKKHTNSCSAVSFNLPFSCLECSPSYSPTDCCCSSDSESDAAGCQLCLLAGSSNTSEDLGDNTLNKSSQWTPQVLRPSRPPTPHTQPPADRKSVSGNNCDGSALQTEGARGQIASPHDDGPRPQSDPFRHPETRDSATQTCDVTKRLTSDASTQSEACVPLSRYGAAPVSHAVPHQDTGGQINSSDRDAPAPRALLLAGLQKQDNRPWRKSSREEGRGHYISGNAIKYGTLNMEGAVGREDMAPPPLGAPGTDDGQERGAKLGGGRGGGGGGGPDGAVAAPPVKEVTTGALNGRSEEVETLQEIADILLMLRQRKREG
ncbi:unnamed protein product [Lota lota]